ncbi:sodium:proton antiporter [Alicyclobacillus sp. SO9]|uniref:cation:proton antiporter n=1 Tax=Alicyclobacillus sp. SO9 TaxID=2665646 RepID=UPI0018E767D2|nr:sodium:proton antiporter [Alicyclobacillus sp. SO9]QQE81319.1 sodium:proton antiporter [Alicyclobacillus sp. SO9]
MATWEGAWRVLLIILVLGLFATKLTEKPRIPDVAAFLIVGLLVGPYVFNWISEPGGSNVNQFILRVGAALILFDGGLSVELSILKKVWISITMLATVGVVVSAAVVGVVAHYAFHLPWLFSLLMAGVIASTDPATLIPVFKRISVWPRLRQTVESESAFNDATASVIVFTLIGIVKSHAQITLWGPVGTFFQESLVGIAVGVVLGLLSLWTVSRKGLGLFHEFGSIVLLTAALGAFQLADLLHGSGYMAAFAAGVIAGNGDSFGWPFAKYTQDNVHHFGNGVTLIFRMLIFVLLGTQVDFGVVFSKLGLGLIVVAVLMVVARPLTVLVSVLIDVNAKWSWREIFFMFWVRETGVIPAALSGIIVAAGIPGGNIIAAVTFMAILITILLQASTTGFVAKKLRLLLESEEEDI